VVFKYAVDIACMLSVFTTHPVTDVTVLCLQCSRLYAVYEQIHPECVAIDRLSYHFASTITNIINIWCTHQMRVKDRL